MSVQGQDTGDARFEMVQGTRFMVFWTPGSTAAAFAEAPPPWADEELATSWCGGLIAGVSAHCDLCEAVALPLTGVRHSADGGVWGTRRVPHDPQCLFSAETINRLHAALQPPGWQELPVTETEIDLLADRLAELHLFNDIIGGQ